MIEDRCNNRNEVRIMGEIDAILVLKEAVYFSEFLCSSVMTCESLKVAKKYIDNAVRACKMFDNESDVTRQQNTRATTVYTRRKTDLFYMSV